MIHRIDGRRGHTGQRQRAAHLFTERGEHFHFATRMLMRLAMLHVDDAHHFIPGDHGGREKRFERVFRQLAEIFEPGVAVSFARNSEQTAFACYPSGETFVQLQANAANLGVVVGVRSTQHEIIAVEKIDETGIALCEFHNERNDTLENFLQSHIPYHEPADFLEKPELLLDSLQTALEVLSFRHFFSIVPDRKVLILGARMTETALTTTPMNDIRSALHIDYSKAAMERIRAQVTGGVTAARFNVAARVNVATGGVAVGGLLLGERAGSQVRVYDACEVACSHAFGPAFRLTPEEVRRIRERIVGSDRGTDARPVIGWYFSKMDGRLAPDEADLATFHALFPSEWQVTLVLAPEGPAETGAMRAAFFHRGPDGRLAMCGEQRIEAPDVTMAGVTAAGITAARITAARAAVPAIEIPVGRTQRPYGVRNWILSAILALATGAAVFEVQNYLAIHAVNAVNTAQPKPASSQPAQPKASEIP